MRITGGEFRGRTLAVPKSGAIRPTSDRVREAMFNILGHGKAAAPLEGRRVIDLFAGTGALGLEALSRGAAYCLFVEESADARALIRRNIEALGLTGVTRIFRRDATRLGPSANMGRFDIAFLDPPYERGLGERALSALAQGEWLARNAAFVLEEREGVEITLGPEFADTDRRTWGETQVVFGRFTGLA